MLSPAPSPSPPPPGANALKVQLEGSCEIGSVTVASSQKLSAVRKAIHAACVLRLPKQGFTFVVRGAPVADLDLLCEASLPRVTPTTAHRLTRVTFLTASGARRAGRPRGGAEAHSG